MISIITIETPSLGDRSYIAHDGSKAVVIDPQRDIDRVLDVLDEHGLDVTHVVETHVHNDYITGGHALATMLDAAYCLNADDDVRFDRVGLHDGDELSSGLMRVRALLTPGHTPTHLSYELLDEDGTSVGVFTGGSMLFGTVGRTDLIGAHMTVELARSQYHSVRRIAAEVDDAASVHPTHGFGSHCSATQATKQSSTVALEKGDNPALVRTEEEFLTELIDGLTPYPTYYRHMAPANVLGPSAFDPTPPEDLDVERVAALLQEGAWIIDLRNRRDFNASFLRGAINAELRNDLPNYLGWMVPFEQHLVLIGDDVTVLAEAQRMLARIGFDRLQGRLVAEEGAFAGHDRERTTPISDFDGLELLEDDARTVLDVRDAWEFASGHHRDAIHIPFHDLPERLDEVPTGRPVWIYCATGARATMGASYLARNGHDVVLIDDFCLPGDVPGRQAVPAGA
jgi:glyoxylase-like metal-dependent hydrolase (beta-lactamase superfamily II)/rhodanese-related sulfurtransferase